VSREERGKAATVIFGGAIGGEPPVLPNPAADADERFQGLFLYLFELGAFTVLCYSLCLLNSPLICHFKLMLIVTKYLLEGSSSAGRSHFADGDRRGLRLGLRNWFGRATGLPLGFSECSICSMLCQRGEHVQRVSGWRQGCFRIVTDWPEVS